MNCQYSSWVFSPSFGGRASRLSYNMARVLALYNCYWVIIKKKIVYARSCINKVTCSVVRYTHAKPQPFINCLRISCEVTRAGVRKDTRKFDFFRNSLYLPLKMDSLPAGHVLTKFWGCRDVCVICYSVLRATAVLDSHTNLLGRKVEPMRCPGPLENRKFLSPYFPSESVRRNTTIHCTLRSRSNIRGFYLSVRQNNLIFFSSSSHSNVVSWFISEQQQFEVLFKSWFQNLQYNIFFVSCRNSVCTQSF